MASLIGQSIGRYHILEQLGEGGMAIVYKAYDTRLETDVAVKVIRRDMFPPSQIDRILIRFEREAKAMAKLSHPNIVKVIDYGEYEGNPYLVMEYLPGGTLKQKQGTAIPWQEAAKILFPIAEALDFAHTHGLVHRDVKPSNILITESGKPMLSDFGISKILDSEATNALTTTGMGMGTPEYMAPEQWKGEITPRTDVYALGVVLYELVTGRKPYIADTPAAILLMQATEPLPRPKKFIPDLPDAVEKIILKALSKKPEDRFSDMAAFTTALESALAGLSLSVGGIPDLSEKKPILRHGSTKDTLTTAEQTRSQEIQLQEKKEKSWRPLVIGLGMVAIIVCIVLGAKFIPDLLTMPTATLIHTDTFTPTATFAPRIRKEDGMVMVYIPAGEFNMGTDAGYLDEQPVHKVYLDGFWIDQIEVTDDMFMNYVIKSGYVNPDWGPDYLSLVIFVTWHEANAYCEWVGARLPSEAEWERAARLSDHDRPDILEMTGNYKFSEWVNDWYSESYYSHSPSANPQGPSTGVYKVVRGFSLYFTSPDANTYDYSVRRKQLPEEADFDLGFRCAFTP